MWTIESGRPDQLGPRRRRRQRPERHGSPSRVDGDGTAHRDRRHPLQSGHGVRRLPFGLWEPPLPPSQHPRPTVAYFRWSWADLEPAEGQYDFVLVDSVIAQAKVKGETLAFRIMTDYGTGSPRWLLDKGVATRQGRRQQFSQITITPPFSTTTRGSSEPSGDGMQAHPTLITWISARWAAGGVEHRLLSRGRSTL